MTPRPKKKPATSPKKTTATPSLAEQIIADFNTLRVPVTAEQLDAALTDAEKNGRTHLEFLQRLLAEQAGWRRQRRIERLIKEANFRQALPLSTFDWSFITPA
jgi:DNA replication protein DnaC